MIRSFIAIFVLTLALTACSLTISSEPSENSTPKTSTSSQHENGKKTIWVSWYRENSKKPQPELLNVISNKQDVEKILKSIGDGVATKINEKNIRELYVLNVTTEKEKQPDDTKYYLYAITRDNKLLIKEINYTSGYHLDEFKATMIPKILHLAGQDNWVEIQKDSVKETDFPV